MNEMLVIDTPEAIEAYRLLALHKALKLECLGMKRSGRSAASIIKVETGLKGTNKTLLERYTQWLKDRGILTK